MTPHFTVEFRSEKNKRSCNNFLAEERQHSTHASTRELYGFAYKRRGKKFCNLFQSEYLGAGGTAIAM